MTEAARMTPTPTSEAARARQVEEAVHSVRMEGLDLATEDAADAAEYVAGRITLDEYGRRTRARYGVPDEESQRGSGAQDRAVAGVAAVAAVAAGQAATGVPSRPAQRGR